MSICLSPSPIACEQFDLVLLEMKALFYSIQLLVNGIATYGGLSKQYIMTDPRYVLQKSTKQLFHLKIQICTASA